MTARDEDIVGYLLDELTLADRARVQRRIDADAAFRDEVERMRPLVAELEALPEEAWGASAPVPPLPPLPPVADLGARRAVIRGRARRPALAAAAVVVALAVGVAIGALVASDDPGPTGPTGREIALSRFGEGGPGASGVAQLESPSGERLHLRVAGLPPSEAGQFYELWLLDGPSAAVSLGVFRVPESGAAELTVPLAFPLSDFRYVDVSVEPEDGVATHSGRSVLRAPTA